MQNKSNSMSRCELPKFPAENDSNIPVLKKTVAGAKKSKGCSKLPELQRYIQTIIEVNNKFENENVSLPDKIPKGKHAVCNRLENKIKEEKHKFDVISNKLKNKRQTSKKYSEAVSRGVEVLHKFFSEFEDPRNWEIQNSGSHLKIERLIEKCYPNPYKIHFENECQNSEAQIFFQKVKNDYLGDETLYDVFISKVDAETQDNLENIDLVSGDLEIILSERENKSTKTSLTISTENINQSVALNKDTKEESKHSLYTSKLTQNTSRPPHPKYTHSISNVNSRAPSREKINQANRKESQINTRKSVFNKKFTKNSSKEIFPKDKKPNDIADYDLGKLELLNLSGSERSKNFQIKKSESKNTNNMTNDDFVNEISSEICNEISKTNDLNDLLQIYEVMNKATESFLCLTSIKKPELENENTKDLPDSQSQADPNSENEASNSADVGQENQKLEYVLEKENNLETITERLENIEEESVNFANEDEESKQKFEDVIFDANQKINEVLQFMNECISKFNNVILSPQRQKDGEEAKKVSSENVLENFEEEKKKNSTEIFLKANDEGKESEIPSTFQKNSFDLINNKKVDSSPPKTSENQPEVNETTNINQNDRIRFKRKSTLFSSLETENPSVTASEASTSNNDAQPEPNAEVDLANNENIVQVAEVLNELGGYTEETQELNTSTEDLRMIKTVLPLSTKVRRSLPETYKTLKDALETEEKLLKLNKPKKLITSNSESQILIQTDPIPGYYPMKRFENFTSGFVFCITPFSQSLTSVRSANLTLPKPLSLSLIDFTSLGLKPLPQIKEEHTEKLFIPTEPKYKAVTAIYSFKIEILSILNKKKVIYYAISVCFPSLIGFSEILKENSIQYSKRQIRVKPLKKYSIVNLDTPGSSGLCIKNTVAFTTSKSDLLNVTESLTSLTEKPVEALLKAIQETENVFLLQQQNNENNHLEPFCSCKSKEALNNESADNEQEKENDKRRVQNLLMRTYRLQKKLHQHLSNINQSLNSPRFLEKELGVVVEEETPLPDVLKTDIKAKPEPLIPTNEEDTKTDVVMVDRGTIYVAPVEEKDSQTICEEPNELNSKSTSEEEKENENDEDDRSSTYSFKSSKDFSETNEVQDLVQEPPNHVTKGEVFKRIFSQIELLKQSVDPENLERQEKKFCNDINLKEEEAYDNEKLVEVDPKNPAKVLKTIFKGRNSSTELTIGLKDVPMKKVRSISVEKTKFSPNHTKISICISKEHGLDITENSDRNSNKVSSYFMNHIRPSLSMSQTDYTKIDDKVSKSSQSLHEISEDEDDDFKSAGSNIVDSNSSTEVNVENTKPESQAVVKAPAAKSYNKHRFDFYRKMDMNVERVRVKQKPTSSAFGRFKELEPLKQALTELQIRMRSIKRDAVLNSNEFYERALKLAKMSAGYCQSCGTRAVIPDDTFGYYKTLLPRRNAQRRNRHFKTTITPNSNFYSFRSSNAELSSQFCDLDITGSSSFSLNRTTHSNRTVLKSLLQDMPILYEKM